MELQEEAMRIWFLGKAFSWLDDLEVVSSKPTSHDCCHLLPLQRVNLFHLRDTGGKGQHTRQWVGHHGQLRSRSNFLGRSLGGTPDTDHLGRGHSED